MIKWFCDLCKKEIEKPENPEYVNVYSEGAHRNCLEADYGGFGASHRIVKLCCHKDCAERISEAIKNTIINMTK